MVAVAVAVGGMALLVRARPRPLGEGAVSVPGIVFGLLAGLMFATAMMLIKSMGDGRARLDLRAVLLPRQRRPAHAARRLADGRQRLSADVDRHVDRRGQRPVYTALCFSLFTDGIRYVRVEHAGILGYLEPVTSPLWAFLLIGEGPPWTTYAGGALIVAAGVLVIVLRQGRGRAAPGAADVSGARRGARRRQRPGRRRRRRPSRRSACAATSRSASPAWPTAPSASWSPTPTCRRPCCCACAWSFAAAALGMVVLATGSWRDLRTPGRAAPRARHQRRAGAEPDPVLPRHPLHGRRRGDLPQLPGAGVPGVRRAADPQGEDRARRVRRPRDRPGRHGADPRAGPAARGRRSSRPPGCSAAGRPASCTRSTCCSPRACAGSTCGARRWCSRRARSPPP